jgi:spiro-SPASM protein
MKNIAVINGIGLRPPAVRPLSDGVSALARAIAFGRGLPGVEEVALLLSQPLLDAGGAIAGVKTILRDDWSVAVLLDVLSALGEGRDDIVYFYGDCPLLDPSLAARMLGNHRRYFADYTFADGFPYGLSAEVLRGETARRLRSLAGDGPDARKAPDRETLFTVIKKDINSFDIETELSAVDLRMLRATLAADSERNFLLLSRVAERGGRDAESACRLLQESPEILRTLPAYFPIQIAERCPQSCSYCPYPAVGGDPTKRSGLMPLDSFASLLDKVERFVGDGVIGVSLWGEPSLHPDIPALVSETLSRPGLELVIETSGIGWDPAVFEKVRSFSSRAPTWIVSLDASQQATYRALRGEGFAEALRTAEALLALFPDSAWVQAVRMKENEEDLEAFFKSWRTRSENVIIQKYDSFCGMLPDRTVADLSPVKRFPCWHLLRDMPILLDGTVPLCREELKAERSLGNALVEDLAAIWERGAAVHRSHLSGEYPGSCARCDEYYTYNF